MSEDDEYERRYYANRADLRDDDPPLWFSTESDPMRSAFDELFDELFRGIDRSVDPESLQHAAPSSHIADSLAYAAAMLATLPK